MRDASGFRATPRQLGHLLRRSAEEWVEDKAPKQAAALAYYVLFAVGPIILIAVSVAGLVFGAEAARHAVASQVGRLVGPEGAAAIDALTDAGLRGRSGAIGLALGVVLLAFGAAGAFAQLRESLNTIWEVRVRKAKGWKASLAGALRRNFLSFAAVLGVGFLLLVSLVLSAGLAALGRHAQHLLPGAEWMWLLANAAVAVLVTGTLFLLLFRFLPEVRIAWRDLAVGAYATGFLFVVGETLIGLYLGTAATASRYGAAGSVLVVLLWVYYSGLILFFGAELTQVYATTYGQGVQPTPRAEPLPEASPEPMPEAGSGPLRNPPSPPVRNQRKPSRTSRSLQRGT